MTKPSAARPAESETGEPLAPTEAFSLPFRGASEPADSYEILLSVGGERTLRSESDPSGDQTQQESQGLELHYTELPTAAPRRNEIGSLIILDAMRVEQSQRPPPRKSEIELAQDRLRILEDDKASVDLRGAQPRENLTPRGVLGHPLALVRYDRSGNPLAILARGTPPVRRFLRPLPARAILNWTRLAYPRGPVSPGDRWTSERFPPSPIGALGLKLPLHYELTGFERIDGIECAWILIHANIDATHVPSVAGFSFDRVVAKVEGQAWVELTSSRLRRMVLEDDTRAQYRRGVGNRSVEMRMRFKTRTVIRLRDSEQPLTTWADGEEIFSRR